MLKCVVALSGGVDSAVALWILKQLSPSVATTSVPPFISHLKRCMSARGLPTSVEVRGAVFMRNWDSRDEFNANGCTSEQDCSDAEAVCDHLRVPFHRADFVADYWTGVFSEMISDYCAGLTPNPDVHCNRVIKFGRLMDHVTQKFGPDTFLATGHYASLAKSNNGSVKLMMPFDIWKDQTFHLSSVHQSSLARAIFPLQNLFKYQVRQIALANLPSSVAKKRDSQGLCFVGTKKSFKEFLSEYVEPTSGPIIDAASGRTLDTHTGVAGYTIGQRIDFHRTPGDYFVAVKRGLATPNALLVCQGWGNPLLFSRHVTIDPSIHVIRGDDASDGFPWQPTDDAEIRLACVSVRIQRAHPLIKAVVLNDRDSKMCRVFLERPLRALNPGQYCVFYHQNECLGSSRIHSTVSIATEMENHSTPPSLPDEAMRWLQSFEPSAPKNDTAYSPWVTFPDKSPKNEVSPCKITPKLEIKSQNLFF